MFLSPKLLKFGKDKGVKFLAWKSGSVNLWTNLMSGCSRGSSCGGRGGARRSRRSCVSSYCSSPASRVRSLDQGGLKGSENSGTDLSGGRGRLGGKCKRSYGGHVSPSKHIHICLLSKTTRLPQFGGLRAEKELPRCFFLSYPLFFSQPFFFYLDHPGKGEQLWVSQGCCFGVHCRAFSRKSFRLA